MENKNGKFYYIEDKTIDKELKNLFLNIYKTYKMYFYENKKLEGKIYVIQNLDKISEIDNFLEYNKKYVTKILKDGENNITYIL